VNAATPTCGEVKLAYQNSECCSADASSKPAECFQQVFPIHSYVNIAGEQTNMMVDFHHPNMYSTAPKTVVNAFGSGGKHKERFTANTPLTTLTDRGHPEIFNYARLVTSGYEFFQMHYDDFDSPHTGSDSFNAAGLAAIIDEAYKHRDGDKVVLNTVSSTTDEVVKMMANMQYRSLFNDKVKEVVLAGVTFTSRSGATKFPDLESYDFANLTSKVTLLTGTYDGLMVGVYGYDQTAMDNVLNQVVAKLANGRTAITMPNMDITDAILGNETTVTKYAAGPEGPEVRNLRLHVDETWTTECDVLPVGHLFGSSDCRYNYMTKLF
jgi:hypothetical protein